MRAFAPFSCNSLVYAGGGRPPQSPRTTKLNSSDARVFLIAKVSLRDLISLFSSHNYLVSPLESVNDPVGSITSPKIWENAATKRRIFECFWAHDTFQKRWEGGRCILASWSILLRSNWVFAELLSWKYSLLISSPGHAPEWPWKEPPSGWAKQSSRSTLRVKYASFIFIFMRSSCSIKNVKI